MRLSIVVALSAFMTFGGLAASPRSALASYGDCSQPQSQGALPAASDCLFILQVAVGSRTCAPHRACVCAPKGILPTSASDALRCLLAAVGTPVFLVCPCDETTTTTSTSMPAPTTTSTTTTSSTSTTIPPECLLDSDCDDGDPCNGFEACDAGSCGAGEPIDCTGADAVLVVPFEEPPVPSQVLVEATTRVSALDVYLLVDRSGSLATEVAALQSGIAAALEDIACPPAGTGTPPDCIADLWAGVGSIGYAGPGGEPYTNQLDLQPDLSVLGAALPGTEPAGCCNEATLLALYSVVTGSGSMGASCTVGDPYDARVGCSGSAAGVNAFGYPCFRAAALHSVVLVTDEQPTSALDCPPIDSVTDIAAAIGIKVVAVYGAGSSEETISELASIATATGAVDATMGDAPMVFDGSDAGTATAVGGALRTLATGTPLAYVTAETLDDGSDSVDATFEFVDRIETAQLGTAACTDGLVDVDRNGDGFPDTFVNLLPGTPVCWRIVARTNTGVAATESPQTFRASVDVFEESGGMLDSIEVLFVVPPAGAAAP